MTTKKRKTELRQKITSKFVWITKPLIGLRELFAKKTCLVCDSLSTTTTFTTETFTP